LGIWGVVMANIRPARDPKRETVSASAVAERLCVVIFENGKVGGRYAMSFDGLAKVGRFSVPETMAGLNFGLRRDWLARDEARAVLKATGIHIAKKALAQLA
jgi:hypothetical protein